ncbi:hypothetical protein OfM1_07820 [Lactovum odontotermitis]
MRRKNKLLNLYFLDISGRFAVQRATILSDVYNAFVYNLENRAKKAAKVTITLAAFCYFSVCQSSNTN